MEKQLNHVKHFHTVFGCPVRQAPGFPTLDADEARHLRCWAGSLAIKADQLKAGSAYAREHQQPGLAELLTRLQLHVEETAELAQAFADRDLVAALDALTDIDYVNNGTYLALGLAGVKADAQEVVHASNMTKVGPDGEAVVDGAGRVVKGQNYQGPEPELQELVEQEMMLYRLQQRA